MGLHTSAALSVSNAFWHDSDQMNLVSFFSKLNNGKAILAKFSMKRR